MITEGQVLVQLDDSQLKAQLEQAEASYTGSKNSQKQAQINLKNAKETLERTKALYAEGAVAKVQLDSDQKAYDLAKIQYESSIASGVGSAKASVDSIETQVQNSTIKSPISGVVVSKNISVGETADCRKSDDISCGFKLFEIEGNCSADCAALYQEG